MKHSCLESPVYNRRRAVSASRPQSGFTLIELLVVIAIIAILAAILFPVFANAREKARAGTCISNMKQIGLGYSQYEQDYDETTPLSSIVGGGAYIGWDAIIQPYMGVKDAGGVNVTVNPTVFDCPDDLLLHPHQGYTAAVSPKSYEPVTSLYGAGFVPHNKTLTVNGIAVQLGQPIQNIDDNAGSFEVVENPNKSAYLGTNDVGPIFGPFCTCSILSAGCNNNNGVVGWITQDCLSGGGQCAAANVQTPLHTGGWNYLYCDGHVKWNRPENTLGTGPRWSPKGPWTITAND